MVSSLRRSFRFTLPLVWSAAIVAALWSLQHYNSIAGRAAAVSTDVSAAPRLAGRAKRLTLYVHPHCPCTRASLAEFRELIDRANAGGREFAAEVVVVVAPGMEPNWHEGAIVRAAEQLAGVSVRFDVDAVEAREVGALTSGHAVLADSAGNTLFRGGITRSRGHAGDNAGTRALTELLNDHKSDVATTPVFGCPLFDPEACASSEACSAASAVKSVSQ